MKKIIALILAAVLTIGCFAACKRDKSEEPAPSAVQETEEPVLSVEPATEEPTEPAVETTPEPVDAYTQIVAAIEKNQFASSVHADIVTDMSFTISIPDASYTESISVRMDMHMDADKEANLQKTEGRRTMSGQSIEAVSYTERVGDMYYSYTSQDNGRTWTVTTQDTANYEKTSDPLYMINVWKDTIKEAAYSGTATVDGRETNLFTGTLSGDYIQIMTGPLAELFAGFSQDEIDSLTEGLDDIPFELNIDIETGYLVRFRADLSSTMATYLARVMEAELRNSEMEMPVEVIDAVIIGEALYSQINAIAPIEIPAEARNAQ